MESLNSTNRAQPSRLAHWMPSLVDVAFLMPILFLFVRLGGAKMLLGDGDTGYHVRTGQWILAHGRVPDRDIFSFTKAGEPWFAWEWLWDVIFGWLHQHWGMAAVVIASMLVISATSALLYRLVRRKCGNALIAIAVTFLVAAGSSIHWLARPHLFTLLFVVIFYGMLERVREGQSRLLIALPFLTVLWTNLHGGFFVGIVLIATYGAGELAWWALAPAGPERRAALARSGPYFLSAGACLLASLVNPYFYHLHTHIWQYLGDPFQFRTIIEFLSISFQHPVARYLEVMVVLGAATAFWNLYQRRFVYVFLIAGWLHLALISARNIPIFMIVAAPPVALAIEELLGRLQGARLAGWLQNAMRGFEELAGGIGATDRLARVPVTSLAAMLLVTVLFYLPTGASALTAEYDPQKYPAKALAALEAAGSAKAIFTDDEWGDYLIYRLYPKSKVFVDGRSDFYGGVFDQKYLDVMNGKYDWEETLERYGVETVLLRAEASLASTLKESRRWRVIYDDGIAIAFRSAARDQTRMAGRESLEGAQVSAATGSGVSRDRKITRLNNPDSGGLEKPAGVANLSARRKPA